jgi:hypothetical protein
MQLKRGLLAAALGTLLIATFAAAAAPPDGRIVSLSVKVSVGSKTIGTFSIDPAQPVPTKPGVTYTLALYGKQTSKGKLVTVPVNSTFAAHAGKGRIVLSNPKSNSIDVKVLKKGDFGNLVKYTTQKGYDIRKNLASGFISLN